MANFFNPYSRGGSRERKTAENRPADAPNLSLGWPSATALRNKEPPSPQTKKTGMLGAFGSLFSKISKKQAEAGDKPSASVKLLGPKFVGRPAETSMSKLPEQSTARLTTSQSGSRLPGTGELQKLAEPPQFVGKFTTESLMKKINANLMDNKAIEDMIAQKKRDAQPLGAQRQAAGKKRTNIVAERVDLGEPSDGSLR